MDHPGLSPGAPARRWIALALCAGACAFACVGSRPDAARAATTTTTIQPNAATTDDSYLREDNTGENRGDDPALRIRATPDDKERNSLVRIPLSGLAGRTVLKAWLELRQSAANSTTPIEARVYPLLESWDESVVTWTRRDLVLVLGTPWATPGGTHGPAWTDRPRLSTATNNTTVQWQVGPIVQAWHSGAMTNYGFVVEPVEGGESREIAFHSSDYGTASLRPRLVIQSTDEPPAVRQATGEIQPRSLRIGATGATLTAWLDVDAAGSTPSGTATGFDTWTIAHGGALIVTAVNRLVVAGASVAPSLVTWTDDGTTVTFRFPRVRANGQVQLDFKVDVLEAARAQIQDLVMTVDDAATPGAASQAVWPGNADRIAGNGDNWALDIVSTLPTSIDLTPDTASMVNRSCLALGLTGRDALGNVFPLVPDSIRVLPSTAGTIGPGLQFCANSTGAVKLVACYATLRDTSVFQVLPEKLTQITALDLRTRGGSPTTTLAPGDTMLLEVTLGDGDGLDDVTALSLELRHSGAGADPVGPAFGAGFGWVRGRAPAWAIDQPAGTSWQVVPALCSFDESSTSTAPQMVRLGFVVGKVARASSGGAWSVTAHATSATPPDVVTATLSSLDAAPRLVLSLADDEATFSAGHPGVIRQPLSTPVDGRLHLALEANAPLVLEARATDLAGGTDPADTLRVAPPVDGLHWSFAADGSGGGALGPAWTALTTRPAPELEAPEAAALHLWIDHPVDIPEQDYLGQLGLRLVSSAPSPNGTSVERTVPTRARVVAAGLAAQLALAEIVPNEVVAGTTAQTFTVELKPLFQGTDTGIDRVRVSVPPGYGKPAVTGVDVGGSPVAFLDKSGVGLAEVELSARVTISQQIRIHLVSDAPHALDPAGSDFVVVFDDGSTNVPPQTATEGDANGLADENSWSVRVVPGPLAGIVVTPPSAVVFRDSAVAFTASGHDALGHPLDVTPAWSVQGGIGTIGAASGLFQATTPGTGRIVATVGAFADTAEVTVLPPRALAIRSLNSVPVVHQGQSGVLIVARVTNVAPAAVTLDTLALRFSRAIPGDGNVDFTVAVSPKAPVVLPPGVTTSLPFGVDVAFDALTAPIAVGLSASGIEEGSGIRLRDLDADTTLAWNVVAGGLEMTATQTPGTIRPGAEAALLTLAITNRYPARRVLSSLVLANRTHGAGNAEEFDAELGEVGLWRDDGDGTFDRDLDRPLLLTSALDGTVTFALLDETFEGQTSARYFVTARPTLGSRDGDVLDLALEGPLAVVFEPASSFRNGWPLDPPGGVAVDGMVAAQVKSSAVGPAALHPGETDRLALDVVLPSNGYAPDELRRLAVINTGTAQAGADLAALRGWVDDGDGAFSPALDRALGPLPFTGGARWQITGLSETVPPSGLRVFVSVDAASSPIENRTVRLALPADPDPGVGMASSNSGPLDAPVLNPSQLTVSSFDRVTLAALPVEGGITSPGERGRAILHLAASNNYSTTRTLTSLVLTNTTSGPGPVAERDGEIRLLTLHADGNGDGTLEEGVDPVLATSFFTGGQAAFTGLDVRIDPLASRQIFVTVDVSPTGARDGDRLAAVVAGPSAVSFDEPTTTTAPWPLDSGTRWTIDGLVAAQVTNRGAPATTVAPGDGPILALDVVLPPNGPSSDVLRGMRLVQLGTAQATDLERVELWRDGGDGVFTGAGDDRLLGPLTSAGSDWTSPLLAETIPVPGARVFVSVDVAAAAAESVTVRFAIPAGGIESESGNDGPLDGAVANPEPILISVAPLLARLETSPASTLGQTVSVSMIVRNASAETVRNVTPSPLDVAGTALLAAASGPLPAAFDLAPAAIDTFTWTFTAQGTGEARFSGRAAGTGDPSGLPRGAPLASSNLHRVHASTGHIALTPVQTMPLRVNRGQGDVVPFSLTLLHPGGADASDVRIDRLSVRLEQESGAPIVPSDLLDRVVVNEGTNVYLTKTTLETTGSDIDLTLAAPAVVTSTQPTTLSLRLDLAADTVVPSFRLVLEDSTRIAAVDGTSGAPVIVRLSEGTYPLRSDVASVVAEASELRVTALPRDTVRAGRGSIGAALVRLRLENPGVNGISSAVRVASIGVALTEASGTPDRPNPAATVGELRVLAVPGGQVLARRIVGANDPDSLDIPLTPPLELAADVPFDVVLVADVAASAPLLPFSARLLGPSYIDARDANTRVPVPVRLTPDPLRGGLVIVEAPAESVLARATAGFPPAVRIGETGVRALAATLRHPGAPGTARVRADSLVLELLDDLRRPVVPAGMIDNVVVLRDGVGIATVTSPPATGSRVVFALGGFLLEPGDSARIEVQVDIEASAPAGFLEIVVPQDGLVFADANTSAPTTAASEAGAPWPLRSGLTRLVTPARELAVGLTSRMPAVLAADGRLAPAALLTLRNTDPEGAGAIELDHLTVRGADRSFTPVAVGGVAEWIEAWKGDSLWARSAVLTADSSTAHLAFVRPLVLAAGDRAEFEMRFVARAQPSGSNLRLGLFEPADVGVVQPSSALLAIAVRPEPGGAFPLWSEAGGLTDVTLAASYANFPNPFAAGREATTIAYFLPGPGRVWLRVFTARGELLATLLDGVSRPSGLHQDDRWNGLNGRGDVVLNGVYVAELEVRFDDGTGQRLRRLVAVVR